MADVNTYGRLLEKELEKLSQTDIQINELTKSLRDFDNRIHLNQKTNGLIQTQMSKLEKDQENYSLSINQQLGSLNNSVTQLFEKTNTNEKFILETQTQNKMELLDYLSKEIENKLNLVDANGQKILNVEQKLTIIKDDFANFKIEIKEEIENLRHELKQELIDFKTELKQEIAQSMTKQSLADNQKLIHLQNKIIEHEKSFETLNSENSENFNGRIRDVENHIQLSLQELKEVQRIQEHLLNQTYKIDNQYGQFNPVETVEREKKIMAKVNECIQTVNDLSFDLSNLKENNQLFIEKSYLDNEKLNLKDEEVSFLSNMLDNIANGNFDDL
eukprot:TRINITY_DN3031_c0_g1_i6.p1 TRINITY_DN3031_c0_g1~~TRINITY_DN3031_c0_g1_i6.p1  ORF type:complete len:341 (+),score=112.54 TRINITY_DN3031_c0_g1_i6:31-1023(+)